LKKIQDIVKSYQRPAYLLWVYVFLFPCSTLKAQYFSQTFNYTGTIQNFTVPPCTFTMMIEARGAQGGGDGGKGARIVGTFTVTPGQVFKILVGKAGSASSPVQAGNGGGGGSFVTDMLNNPYVVAGGGGGSGRNWANSNYVSIGGTTAQNGEPGQSGGLGGVGGTGGAVGTIPQINAAGGGGITTNGGGGGFASGGGSYVSGGAGGNSTGGYGGGGGSSVFIATCGSSPNGGAGGGGYSGGGGGGSLGPGACDGAGGGGGSFNGGTSQVNTPAWNPGNGMVVFSYGYAIQVTASPTAVCAGSPSTLTISGPLSQTWSVNGLPTSNTIVVNPTVTTNYSALLTPPQGCNIQLASITVTAWPLPILTVTSTVGCPSGSVSLFSSGAVTYTWQPGNLPGAPATAFPPAAGIYTCYGTDALGCTNTQTLAQAVLPIPTITATSPTVCQGAPYSIVPGGALSYTWNPGNLPGIVTGIANGPLTYTVIGASAQGCTASTTTSLSIYNPPAPPLSFTTTGISCASLGSATVSAAGPGPYIYTWTPINQFNPTVTGLGPGTYTLTIFDVGASCISTTTATFNSALPFTGNLNYTSSLTCNGVNNGAGYYTNLSGGSGNQNFAWTNGMTLSNLPNPTNLGAGNWTVTVTDALSGCAINNTFVITQPPPLTLNLASGSATACANSSVVLSSTLTGGIAPYQFNWIGGPSTSTYAVSAPLGGAYMYTLNVTDFNGCPVNAMIGMIFVSTPQLNVSDVSICPQGSGALSVSGANTYTWSDNTYGSSLFASPPVSTQYTVIGSALGCTTAATASIVVLPVPFTVGSDSPRCFGDALQLSATGGTAYTWTGPSAYNSSAQNPYISPVGPAQAGVYYLTLTALNGCTAAASVTVVVNPTPTVQAAGGTVCTSQVLLLTSGSVPGATFQWAGPAGYGSAQQNPVIPGPSMNATGMYTVTATSLDGCTNTAVASASIVSPPSLTISLSSTTLCAQGFNGSPSSISINVSGASSYTIATPIDIYNSNFNGPSSLMSALPPYNPGPGAITVVGSNGICTSIATAGFLVLPNPVITVSSPSAAICSGQSHTFTTQGVGSYVWSPPIPGLTTYNMGSMAVVSPTTSTIFSVYGSSGGCNGPSLNIGVTVNLTPTTTVASKTLEVCMGMPIILAAGGNAISYSWAPALGLNSQSGRTVTATLSGNQQYTVTGSANNCSSMAMVAVTVFALPVPQISVSKSAVCIYDTISLSGTGGNSYHWTGPYNFDMSGKNISFTAANLARSGTYTLTVTDLHGCRNSTITGVTIYEMPQVSLDGTTIGCAPFCPRLKLSRASSATSSLIITGWETTGQNLPDVHFTTCLNVPGDHILNAKFKDSFTGCSNTQTFAVSVLSPPKADFTWEPQTPVEKVDEVQFINTSKGPGQQRWSWYFVDNSGPVLDWENPTMNFDNAGNFAVAMIVWDNNQCSDTMVKTITVIPDFNVYIPNSFTPNGDGLNDTFQPMARNYKGNYSLQVFNRWGQMVFTTTNINDGWNGTFLNQSCKEESYIYLIKLAAGDGAEKEYKGTVTLVR
jgi:gliding motility-associated-like protein